jgi:hypothetical protein
LSQMKMTLTARPKCPDDVGAADLWELMAFSGEAPNVIPQGIALLLLATLQIPGVAGLHICALKVAGEDLLEIFLAIN